MRRFLGWVYSIIVILGVLLGVAGLAVTPARTTLRVLSFKDGHALAVQSLLPRFEAATGISVQLDLVPAPSVAAKVLTDQSGGAHYDVYLVDEPYLPQLAPFLLPHAEWPDVTGAAGSAEFVAPAAAASSFRGKSYGLPVNGNIYLYVYRKDLFEDPAEKAAFHKRYGVPLEPPQDLASFERIAAFFHRPPSLYGFAPFTRSSEGTTVEMLWILGLTGVRVFDDRMNVVARPEAIADALKTYRQLMSFAPPGSRMWHHAERMRAYARGLVAQIMTWPSFLRDLENPSKSLVVGESAYGARSAGTAAARPPGSSGGSGGGSLESAGVAGTWIVTIARHTSKARAAAQFAQWWASSPDTAELLRRGMNPARRDVLSDQSLAQQYPWFAATLEGFAHAQVRPRTNRYAQLSRLMSATFTAAVTAEGSPDSCDHCSSLAVELVAALRGELNDNGVAK